MPINTPVVSSSVAEPVAPKIPVAKPAPAPKESSRPKTTLSLNDLFKNSEKTEQATEKKEEALPERNEPVTQELLSNAWNNFAEQRKDQVAEYHLLQQPYELNGTSITIHLTNPIEEPLLQSLKPSLVEYLREHLKNNSLQVHGTLKTTESKKKAYTNKEKFDQMVEQNPALAELKARFGLDPDF